MATISQSIVLLDKPAGPTSFRATQMVARRFGVTRAGHSGTLDSGATGVLVIALGEARKAMSLLIGLDKEYRAAMRLHGDISPDELRSAFAEFTGEITQLPPVRSAVKREPRKRFVHSIELLALQGRDAEVFVKCQAGTYIRKLLHDIGQHLGCGAHMARLQRIAVGPFRIEECVGIDEMDQSNLIPLREALERVGIRGTGLTAEQIEEIRNGRPVPIEEVAATPSASTETLILTDSAGEVVAFARQRGSHLAPYKVLNPSNL